jgi:multidrug resistance efflux pump
MNFVEVRPRVTGCLKRMPFKGRTVVKKGEFLFEIDDRPYDRMRPGYG